MTATSSPSKTSPTRRWLKRLGLAAGVLVLLLVVAFFVVTSSAFLKGVVLPRVGTAISATVSADAVGLSPFSSLTISGLKVATTGSEPLVELKDFRVRYSLSDILGGKITVDEMTLDSPAIHLVLNADGTSNLDPLLKGSSEPEKKTKPSAPPQLAVRNVQLKNAIVHVVQKQKDGTEAVYEISGLNVSLDQLVNGAKSTVKIGAALKGSQTGTNAFSFAGTLDGDVAADLTADLLPKQATGAIKAAVSDATGALAAAKGFQITLNTELTPTELRDLSLGVLRNSESLATLKVSGPFDAAQRNGQLKIALTGVDRRLLGFVRELTGTDFGDSALSLAADVSLADGGKQLGVVGSFSGKALSIKPRGGSATPPTDLALTYDVSLKDNVATIRDLSLSPAVNGKPGGLVKIGGDYDLKTGSGNATLHLAGLNQDLVNPFVGTALPDRALVSMSLAGDATARLVNGVPVLLKAGIDLSNVVTRTTGSSKNDAPMRLLFNTDLTPTDLHDLSLTFFRNTDTLGALKVSGPFDALKRNGQLKVALTGIDHRLLGFVRDLTGTDFGNSALSLNADISLADGGKQLGVVGKLDGKALSVKPSGGTATPPTDLALTYDVGLKDDVATIRDLTLAPAVNGRAGGRVGVAGNFNTKSRSGSITVRLTGLNQDLVSPFMGGAIAGRDLLSMSLGGDATVQIADGGLIGLKAGFSLSNLVTRTKGNTTAEAPMEFAISTDVGMKGPVIDLRSLLVHLPPTTNADNRLTLSGKVDRTKPDAISGQLTLASDALDLTPLYDLLAGGPTATNTPAAKTEPSAPATNEEPAPVTLPVGDFTIAAKIGRILLREVAATNLVLNARATSSTIVVKPLTLSLNGAPVSASADLDLGVKGWRYDVGLKLARVPVQPFADSFMPDRRGQLDGTILVDAAVKGAGVTGTNLKKSLTGGASFSLTNVNVQVVSDKWKPVLTVIGLALRITDIAQSPLNAIYSDVRFGGGNIDLKSFTVESEAFRANAATVVPIVDVLNDSPLDSVPVAVELRRSLAQKANLLPDNTPTNAKYAALPNFVKLNGTLGKPEANIDKGVVALLLLKSTPAGTVVNAAGGVLKTGSGAVGNVLGGLLGTGTSTNAPTGGTNAPPKNALKDLLNPFGR
jgi:hypothetical protein